MNTSQQYEQNVSVQDHLNCTRCRPTTRVKDNGSQHLIGCLIGIFGGGTFFEVETNIKERKHLREALVSYRKLPVVQ